MEEKPYCGKSRQRLDTMKNTNAFDITELLSIPILKFYKF